MPEQNQEQINKKEESPKIELEEEIKIESLPPQEIKEMREAVIEEIGSAERPKHAIPKKFIPPFKKEEEKVIVPKSQTYREIEKIMEDGLAEVYLKMNPNQQKIFKEEGEETVSKIEKLLLVAKVKIKSILKLIRDWLLLIPGVNRFFLEQEAKIKCDKILKIKK